MVHLVCSFELVNLTISGFLGSNALNLPGKNVLNALMFAATLGLGYLYLGAHSLTESLQLLSACAALSFILGWHTTASIGGADMPVVITVLNSYSGWAICSEVSTPILPSNSLFSHDLFLGFHVE